ncbi:MAG: hypothetical protein CO108_06250 [Deltaproteobacteria bacterium CG_4_9_14_3_um_filter_63_12]|nr:MAG: hypothetical protein CO108_06250 [Deltaproteobacteria bacterium CG_4_9_14_3_um_filter_63_12]
MSRQFGYLGSDFSLFDLALKTCGDSLSFVAETPCDGWGLGYYQDERALVRKQPARLMGRVNLATLAADVLSHSMVAHVRHGSEGTPPPQDMQPYRFRNWLFTHDGHVTRTPEGRAALLGLLPDFLQRNVRGQTDSELALHLFFEKLNKRTRIDRAIVPVPALFESMRETLTDIRRTIMTATEENPVLNFMFVSGRCIAATCTSDSTLAYLPIRGLERQEKPLFAGHTPDTQQFPHFKAVFVTTDPAPSDVPWQVVPCNTILVVDEKFEVHIQPIEL